MARKFQPVTAEQPNARQRKFRTPSVYKAWCSCGWSCRASNALAAGASHARARGHKVQVKCSRTFIYDYRGFDEDEEDGVLAQEKGVEIEMPEKVMSL